MQVLTTAPFLLPTGTCGPASFSTTPIAAVATAALSAAFAATAVSTALTTTSLAAALAAATHAAALATAMPTSTNAAPAICNPIAGRHLLCIRLCHLHQARRLPSLRRQARRQRRL